MILNAFYILLVILTGAVVVGGIMFAAGIFRQLHSASQVRVLKDKAEAEDLQFLRKKQAIQQEAQLDVLLGDRQLMPGKPEEQTEKVDVRGKDVEQPWDKDQFRADRIHDYEKRSAVDADIKHG